MRARPSPIAIAILTAAIAALASCAGAPKAATPVPAAQQTREVTWEDAVKADFEKEVPKYVRALAKSKMEDMAREKGTYFVDRALYLEAMAAYKR